MSANPRITAVSAGFLSPNEHIRRYLLSLQTADLKSGPDQPPSPPTPTPEDGPNPTDMRNHGGQEVGRQRAVARLPPSREQVRAQLAQVVSKWRRGGDGEAEQKRSRGAQQNEGYMAGNSRRNDLDPNKDVVGQPEGDEKWETESAARRMERKLRRREKAAIVKPKIPAPTPPPKANREKRQLSPSIASERETIRPTPRKPDYLARFPLIVRNFQAPNIRAPGERLTLSAPPGKPQGFLSKGKASRPIDMRLAESSRPPRAGIFSENEFLGINPHRSSSEHYVPEQRQWERRPSPPSPASYRRPLVPRNTQSSHEDRPLISFSKEQAMAPSLRSGPSYSRLPPPGLTNSPSWPTNPSDLQDSLKCVRPAPPLPLPPVRDQQSTSMLPPPKRRSPSPSPRVPMAPLHQPPPSYASEGQAEFNKIVTNGRWRWPPEQAFHTVTPSIRPAPVHHPAAIPRTQPSLTQATSTRFVPRQTPSSGDIQAPNPFSSPLFHLDQNAPPAPEKTAPLRSISPSPPRPRRVHSHTSDGEAFWQSQTETSPQSKIEHYAFWPDPVRPSYDSVQDQHHPAATTVIGQNRSFHMDIDDARHIRSATEEISQHARSGERGRWIGDRSGDTTHQTTGDGHNQASSGMFFALGSDKAKAKREEEIEQYGATEEEWKSLWRNPRSGRTVANL